MHKKLLFRKLVGVISSDGYQNGSGRTPSPKTGCKINNLSFQDNNSEELNSKWTFQNT